MSDQWPARQKARRSGPRTNWELLTVRCPVCCSETGTNSGASVGRPDSLRSAEDSPYARSNSLLRGTANGNFPKQQQGG